ncbi:DUF6704 family protein [Microbacterium gorillae]|uniref:DUF6704 family protein n=1 Tax=Microbacterium gorillae TaxID=1231063 RepID=UPI00059071F6|nr:DUF6704 family protein [Microbacterium gorillae]
MSNPIADPGHGHSPAAWTAVVIMLVAIGLGTLFFAMNIPALVWVCAALVVVGLIVGVVMAKAGYGVKGPKYVAKKH